LGECGGCMRSIACVNDALEASAARVIIGTAAFADPDLLRVAREAHGSERVLVSVDVRGGRLSTAGWTETTDYSTEQVLSRLQSSGVRELVYTNVDRDGMLAGPDIEEVRTVAGLVSGRFLYSGGIGALSDLE